MGIQDQEASSWLNGPNAAYIESFYESWLKDPASVSEEWRDYFSQMVMRDAGDASREVLHSEILTSLANQRHAGVVCAVNQKDVEVAEKQVFVQQLIAAYRVLGTRRAQLDPLKRREAPVIRELEPSFYGLTDADLDTEFHITNTYFGARKMPLRTLLTALRETYCSAIGAEFMYISDPEQKRWWQQKLEKSRSRPTYTAPRRRAILEGLTAAEGLERYLHTRYVGQKRFSLEGGESFITAMQTVLSEAARHGVEDCVIGMAHRGRLNVLVNIIGKSPKDLFAEFEGAASSDLPAGDVKYHNGFSSDRMIDGHHLHLALEFNPSHLEIVDPVVVGSVRARQDRRPDRVQAEKAVLGVMVHGDAAFPGQGVVMETLNLADTRGYGTGGTVHIVINNQIGFTTSDPRDKGSMTYCTDPAKLIEAPVLHVNGDDPDAVAFATELICEYQRTFQKDAVLDIVCFRKLGHNEQDTPAVTQPLMYRAIAKHPGTRALYAQKLAGAGVIGKDEGDVMVETIRARLKQGQSPLPMNMLTERYRWRADWTRFAHGTMDLVDTRVPAAELNRLGQAITNIPESFELHPIVAKVIADRRKMAAGELKVDWGMAEHLAYASLLTSGYPVRLTGEDSGRGTFSHRHAVLHDQKREKWDEGVYVPLEHLGEGAAPFTVIDSVLSENAVLGFEYGYATAAPDSLVIWEAQFGDFANGAQVVIDQFISSGEAKWGRLCGLVLLLPHGYEGQGPEHSSARIERFLQLCAGDNMRVMQPSCAAQMFHLIRQQMLQRTRKPLIVFTPKSLLRNKAAANDLTDLSEGALRAVIDDTTPDPEKVRRIVVCSGRVYYDLVKRREELHEEARGHYALVRLEQLYPFPHADVAAVIARYANAQEVIWCQDEPQNQGVWNYAKTRILQNMRSGMTLGYAGRAESPSPAVGYGARHQQQLKELLEAAYAPQKGFILTA